MMKVIGFAQSGNCYKIKLTCALLGIAHEWEEVDIMQGYTKTDAFLRINPNGKIPVVVFDDGRILMESNAIINYLAAGSPLVPTEPFQLALVQQWQFFEQYSHEPYIAVARFIEKFQGMPEARRNEYNGKQEGGYKALKIMEQQLNATEFLVGDSITVADISLYAYTHVAHEGGFSLSDFPAIQRWIARIEAAEGYVSMDD